MEHIPSPCFNSHALSDGSARHIKLKISTCSVWVIFLSSKEELHTKQTYLNTVGLWKLYLQKENVFLFCCYLEWFLHLESSTLLVETDTALPSCHCIHWKQQDFIYTDQFAWSRSPRLDLTDCSLFYMVLWRETFVIIDLIQHQLK